MTGNAEGASNLYWSDPKTEGPKIAKVDPLVLDRAGEDVLFYVANSKNEDVVVYSWNKKATSTDDLLDMRWLLLDPKSLGDNLSDEAFKDARGNYWKPLDHMQEMYLGVSVKKSANKRGEAVILVSMDVADHVTLRRKLSMQLCEGPDGEKLLQTTIEGKPARLDKAYVHMSKGLTPDVDYIRTYGTQMAEPWEELTEIIEKPRHSG